MAQRASRNTRSLMLALFVVAVVPSWSIAQGNSARHGPIVQQLAAPEPTQAQAPGESAAEPVAVDPVTNTDDAARAAGTANNAAHAIEMRPLGQTASNPSPVVQPASAASASTNKPTWWLRTALALGLVITLIMLFRTVLQRLAGAAGGLSNQLGAGGRAPSGVLEVLGRFPVARGHTLVLLKMDRRILLLGQTASGFTPLSEVRDPDEVASLLIKVKDDEGQSLTARFNSILHDAERDQELLDEPISIVDRDPEAPADEDDPAASLRHRLLGLRGLEA